MNEFFADTIELWSFSLLEKKFQLIINNSHNQFWKEFFSEIESGDEYETSKMNLINKAIKYKLKNSENENLNMILQKNPSYIDHYLSSNFEKLEKDDEFLSLIREIRIKKIID